MSEVKRTDEIQGDIIHEYDGIEEADNALPNWWLWIFYATIVFSTLYWLGYHEWGAASLADEYAADQRAAAEAIERAAAARPVTAEALEELAGKADVVAEGKAAFLTNCAPCHAERAEGRVGPNLTDRYWIHGGSPTDIYSVVSKGVPNVTTMPAWEARLGRAATRKVVAYVLSLRDTNVPGKAPQGRSWPDGEPAPGDPAAADGGAAPAPAPSPEGTGN